MDANLPFLILYACLSVLLFLWDAKHGLLPDRFTCPLLWSGLLFSQVCNPDGLADALWGAIIGYGTFAVIYWGYRILRHKEGLGYGDVKFLAALGAAYLDLLATTGFPCCLIRLRSRSCWSAHERKRVIKKPAAVWAISGGCGFRCRLG